MELIKVKPDDKVSCPYCGLIADVCSQFESTRFEGGVIIIDCFCSNRNTEYKLRYELVGMLVEVDTDSHVPLILTQRDEIAKSDLASLMANYILDDEGERDSYFEFCKERGFDPAKKNNIAHVFGIALEHSGLIVHADGRVGPRG